VPTNYSDYLHYAAPLNDSTQARYGFQYVPGQFDYKSLADAMVVVYHIWTESHHYIDRLITTNNTVLFTNPSRHPIGSEVMAGQRRFHIENLCEALTPNSFFFVNATKTVTLTTDGSYDPTKVQIIILVNEFVLIIAGEDVKKPVKDIIISNVAIQHSAWNITRTEQADKQAAAFLTHAAVYIANATLIIISDVEVSHTGSYAVWIKEETTSINAIDSLVTDTGAGSIRIGQIITPVPTPTSSVNIMSTEVSYGGNVFPNGVAIISHRCSGIYIGWLWGYGTPFSNNVIVEGNYIYSIG
jgi:hypothetical protein